MPDDILTLESAISLLKPGAVETPPPDDQNTPDTNAAPDSGAPNSADAAPDAQADANTDAPENDPGKTTEGDVDPGDALPPIEAPSTWSTEDKAEWNGLSRKAQEVILRRAQDDIKALRNAQNSTAESNKKVEAEVARLQGIAAQMDGYLNEKVAELARDFPEIKSEADLVALAQSDPAKYTAFQARLQALGSANQAKLNASKELERKAQEQQNANLVKAKDALIEAFPAWKDAEVARRESTELQDYVIKNYGVPEAAARASVDPAIYRMAQKAMLYDRAQAAKTAALTRTPPRTVPPGARNSDPGKTAREESRRSQLDKLGKSGDIDDALGLLRA